MLTEIKLCEPSNEMLLRGLRKKNKRRKEKKEKEIELMEHQ